MLGYFKIGKQNQQSFKGFFFFFCFGWNVPLFGLWENVEKGIWGSKDIGILTLMVMESEKCGLKEVSSSFRLFLLNREEEIVNND